MRSNSKFSHSYADLCGRGPRDTGVLVPAPAGPKRQASWQQRWTPESAGQGRGAFRGVAGAGRRRCPRNEGPCHRARVLQGHAELGCRLLTATAAGTPWAPRRLQRGRGHGNPSAHRPAPAPPPRLPLSRWSPKSRRLIVQRRD